MSHTVTQHRPHFSTICGLQVLRSPRAEHSADSSSVRPFEEKLGRRFMITCRSLKLMLQGCINESETDPVTNVSGHKNVRRDAS